MSSNLAALIEKISHLYGILSKKKDYNVSIIFDNTQTDNRKKWEARCDARNKFAIDPETAAKELLESLVNELKSNTESLEERVKQQRQVLSGFNN